MYQLRPRVSALSSLKRIFPSLPSPLLLNSNSTPRYPHIVNPKISPNTQTYNKFTMGSTQDMSRGKPVLFLLVSGFLPHMNFELTLMQ